ncbi:MAG: hypothetical protein ACOCU3_01520 [bacterium]
MRPQKPFLTIFAFLLVVNITAQKSDDFIVVDEIAGNIEQLKMQYKGTPNAYFTEGIQPLAPEQIAIALETQQAEDLHIHVPTKPGALVFNSIAITPDKVAKLAEPLKKWGNHVSGQVFIHSDIVFTTGKGVELKQKLEDITGLAFSMH